MGAKTRFIGFSALKLVFTSALYFRHIHILPRLFSKKPPIYGLYPALTLFYSILFVFIGFVFCVSLHRCSRTTVIQVLNIAEEKGICYPLPSELSDRKLAELLFPSEKARPGYKMPDYGYVHKELQRSGVTLNLL